ncbi:carboxypeptidase O-like isoform X1 [Varroa jacobsoni]|uniref:Peptidase M14 domain-containing protein n=1 Tax=Varroa destructor TaxID=109461 RepID=A0A7M7M8M7_VARDE|nr:carboxypeptidase O-like isoform X2 [Varroa destructor]XP_022699807.1 carboxypeptidase O-like isoform X1 [Varroa jacobsoni]
MFPTFVATHLVSTLVHMGNTSHRLTQCCLNETYCISVDTERYPDLLIKPSTTPLPSFHDPIGWGPPELHTLPTFNRSKSPFLEGFYLNKFHGIDQIYRFLEAITESSKLATLLNLGFTFETRPLLGLMITSRVRPDPRDPEAPAIVFVECGMHAREWTAPAACLLVIHQLVSHYDKDTEVRRMVDDFEWRIFPVMNPDGYAYSMSVDRLWKKNRSKLRPADKNGGSPFSNCSGVDLNRNFDTAEFCENANLQDPCGPDYCGRHPFSELETRALKDHILGLRRARSRQSRIQFYFSVHSYAQLWIFPHGHRNGSLSLEERRRLEGVSRGAVHEISKIKGGFGQWRYGNITQLLGYTGPGASTDWAFDSAGIFYSFAIELGPHSSVGETFGYTVSELQIPRSATELWVGLKYCTLNY